MNDLLEKFEKKQIETLVSKKGIPAFRAGDTLKVTLKITEGDRSRFQAFEGVCIARKNNSINSKFTVRKISHGEGVERIFPLFSPLIEKIEVVRKGDVKRAKLYYLRSRTGKSARIADQDRGEEADQYLMTESEPLNVDENNKDDTQDKSSKNDNLEINENEDKVEIKTAEEPVAEAKKPAEEKSESTASKADKTEDESKT